MSRFWDNVTNQVARGAQQRQAQRARERQLERNRQYQEQRQRELALERERRYQQQMEERERRQQQQHEERQRRIDAQQQQRREQMQQREREVWYRTNPGQPLPPHLDPMQQQQQQQQQYPQQYPQQQQQQYQQQDPRDSKYHHQPRDIDFRSNPPVQRNPHSSAPQTQGGIRKQIRESRREEQLLTQEYLDGGRVTAAQVVEQQQNTVSLQYDAKRQRRAKRQERRARRKEGQPSL